MSAPTVYVAGVGLWMQRYPSAAAWTARAPEVSEEPLKPKGEAFDRVNRRRASQMGRAIGDAVCARRGRFARLLARTRGSSLLGKIFGLWR